MFLTSSLRHPLNLLNWHNQSNVSSGKAWSKSHWGWGSKFSWGESRSVPTRRQWRTQQGVGQRFQVQELPKETQLAETTYMCSPALCCLWGSHLMLMEAEATEGTHPDGLKYSLVFLSRKEFAAPFLLPVQAWESRGLPSILHQKFPSVLLLCLLTTQYTTNCAIAVWMLAIVQVIPIAVPSP